MQLIKKFNLSLYSAVNFFFAVLLPGYSLLIGDSTIFYLIYLYWCQELIASAIEGIYYVKNREAYPEIPSNPFWARLFLLFIYFVFIIIFFGLVSDWGNDQRIKKNLEIFLFKDVFFMINLTGLARYPFIVIVSPEIVHLNKGKLSWYLKKSGIT